jgi:hypothetical protein
MVTSTPEGSPPDPLPGVSLAELISQARELADTDTVMRRRGEIVVSLRSRGLSWRQIEQKTGMPQVSARRWAERFLNPEV